MERHGIFDKEGDPFPGMPYSPFFGVPHNIKTDTDMRAWEKRKKEDKRKCVDFGKCNMCLNGTCRIIRE
jgi:hypothetical protein